MTSERYHDLERALRMKRMIEADFITAAIQEVAGASEVRRAPITGPDWPVRADYPNRAAYRRACAEWRSCP
jgi:hypothetical protein